MTAKQNDASAAREPGFARIMDAALDLFARQGYVATGIRDIAREAGLSSATLYHHVANKEEILVAIMREAFEGLIANAAEAIAGLRSPESRLAALVTQHVLTETTSLTLANVATVEFRFLGPEARAQVVPLRDEYERIWDGVLEAGLESNAFRIEDRRITRLALLQLCGGPEEWFRPDGELTAEQVAELYVVMALRLVGARRPRRTG